ncbi:MAG: PASTA domain-containing protein, partial [Trueperaceae bacterium]|nr:PASTA domain-containing protein [Trueperaceae bacterium]
MPLIDGTYEVLEQRATGDGRTLVRATDPAGTPVRLVVYDLPPDAEPAFETYRRTLKRLARDPDVRLLDVVSRPGARYAVWADPTGWPRASLDDAWRARLEGAGLDPAAADLRRDGDAVVLAGLDGDLDDVAAGDGGAGHAPEPGRPSPRAVRTAAATALAFGLAILLALVGWRGTVNDAVVTLPDLAGASASDAAADLAALGVRVAPVAVPGDAPAGTVLRTAPPAGTSLRPGRTVRLTYVEANAGPAATPLPSLVGRTRSEAEAHLREGGFVVGDVARIPAAVPAGTVVAHAPGPNGDRPPGTAVHLLLSDGPRPERTFLPDLRGLDVAVARDLARVAGWSADRVVVERVAASGAAPGTVLATTPAPWHAVRVRASTVRLLVADAEGAPFFD